MICPIISLLCVYRLNGCPSLIVSMERDIINWAKGRRGLSKNLEKSPNLSQKNPLQAVGLPLWLGTRWHWCKLRKHYICPALASPTSELSSKARLQYPCITGYGEQVVSWGRTFLKTRIESTPRHLHRPRYKYMCEYVHMRSEDGFKRQSQQYSWLLLFSSIQLYILVHFGQILISKTKL